MSYQVRSRRTGESRLRWRLSRPYSWSWPPGWGWEGPDATGSAMTAWGAKRQMRRAAQTRTHITIDKDSVK